MMKRFGGTLFLILSLAWTAGAQTQIPAYACVAVDGNAFTALNVVEFNASCPEGQTKMLLLMMKNLPFVASTPGPSNIIITKHVSTFLATPVTIASTNPLLIGITLEINTDAGFYTIPTDSDANAGLACVPTVDQQAVGTPLAVTTGAAQLAAATANPPVPGFYPYTDWPVIRSVTPAASGRHQVGVQCQAASSFRFRGSATVVVLQHIPGAE
jgi:hypothetical protein